MSDHTKLADSGAKAKDGTRKALKRTGDSIKRTGEGVKRRVQKVHGPSTNPATNLLIADLVMRSSMILFRRGLERTLLSARFDRDKALEIINGRPVAQSLALGLISRQATKSIPGMVLLGGGILAKVAFDRGRGRRKAKREGIRELDKMAENGKDD